MDSGPHASPWWAPDRHADRRLFLQKRAADHGGRAGLVPQRTDLPRSRPPCCRSRRATKRICMRRKPSTIGPDGEGARRYLAHLAGIRLQEAARRGREAASSISRASSAIASAARCICPNSPCWNGTARTSPMRRSSPTRLAVIALAARDRRQHGISAIAGAPPIRLPPPSASTVAEAFERHAGIDLRGTYDQVRHATATRSAAAAERRASASRHDDTWSDIFTKVLVENVEPQLGQGRLTVLDEYPLPEAALARPSADPIRWSPSVSRSMPAASNSPTASAN